MVTVLGYSPKVSVETIWRDTFWLLIVTISISDPIPPGLDLKLVSLYEPFVTLMDGQKPPVRFPLIWFNDGIWRNFWTTLVEPSQPMRELVVAVRNGFGGKYTQSKDDTWKMSLDLTPKVSRQIPSYRGLQLTRCRFTSKLLQNIKLQFLSITPIRRFLPSPVSPMEIDGLITSRNYKTQS